MKSQKYRKYHASKYQFPTYTVAGTGNTKGKLVVGSEAGLQGVQKLLGRTLNVAKTDHTRHEWVFCERKGTPRSPKTSK